MGNCYEYLEFTQKSKPQGNAMVGGIFVLLISGMQIGWLFDNNIRNLPWAEEFSSIQITFNFASFYISAIVGLFCASATNYRLTKLNIYFSSLTFVVFGSGCLIFSPNDFYLALVSRFLIGFGHGYAYITVIVHASEIMHQKLRGMIVTAFQMCTISSMVVTNSLTNAEGNMSAFKWIGIIGLIYSILGFLFMFAFTKESPVKLMRDKKFDEALNIMIRVRSESTETWSIRNEFNELKTMVEEDEETSHNIFENGNARPLILITLLKIAFVVSFNYGLNMIRFKYTKAFITEDGINMTGLTYISLRLIVIFFTMFSIEFNGRRRHFIVSHGAAGCLLIVFGLLVFIQPTSFAFYEILQILFEIACGLGMGILADVYSSEAFNAMKKPRSLFVSTTVEFVLQILLIYATLSIKAGSTFDAIYLIASGALLCFITWFLYKELPETVKMSIRQTRSEFLRRGEIVFSGSTKNPPMHITYD